MATLVREQDKITISNDGLDLENGVPTPFPKDLTAQLLLDELAAEDAGLSLTSNAGPSSTGVSRLALRVSTEHVSDREVGPSLTQVEQACLMTLNNLLCQDTEDWQQIVPSRRHSLPAQSPTRPNFQNLVNQHSSSSALQTILNNLRSHYPSDSASSAENDDASFLLELQSRVTRLIDEETVPSRDAPLVQSLVLLLSHMKRVANMSPDVTHFSPVDVQYPLSTAEIYDTLSRRLAELQSHRDAHISQELAPEKHRPPIEAVEHAILWHKIDDELDDVLRLCRERAEPVPYNSDGLLPPEYEADESEPPIYDPAEYSEVAVAKAASKSQKSQVAPPTQSIHDEKMRLDLEAVTMAIDRLYMVAPQLSNQRVELKRDKLDQMEKARISGSSKGKGKGKEAITKGRAEKENDFRELDKMLELINKSSARRFDDQSVVLDGERGMAERIEKARLRDIEKRNAFQERLVTHANSRRLTSQDAELSKSTSNASLRSKTRNPDALLTLPEFIKELMADDTDLQDPNALLTLPEFVKENPPPALPNRPAQLQTPASKFKRRPFHQMRSRSVSAPPLALSWLLPSALSSSKSTQTNGGDSTRHTERSTTPSRAGLSVHYIAEHHENLGNVAVFLEVNGAEAGADVDAEVFSSGDERLIVKSGASTSPPLALPARVTPGKKDVRVQSGHFVLKLECMSGQSKSSMTTQYNGDCLANVLLDSAQIRNIHPTTFICSSCSLPLVQASKLSRYDDLPSEHWAELVEAWMCHSDQKMTDSIASYAKGLWPVPGQALVGGSYILFDSTSLVTSSIRPIERNQSDERSDEWVPIKCICGAGMGRSIQHDSPDGTQSVTYRLAKYALRPVSPSSDPLKIPLSAFILQDMDELVQAHAAYRFVLLDEEEEKPRILVWLFKQHMNISYNASSHKLLARSASVQVAKVHFKTLGPSVSPTIKSTLEKYPGFTPSERLVYPMEICRRLAGLLRESNITYPQGMRVMGGLDVGWLLRA